MNTFTVLAPTDAQLSYIAGLCACHRFVTAEHVGLRRLLAERLTDGEYAGLIEAGGEGIIVRLFGVEYAR